MSLISYMKIVQDKLLNRTQIQPAPIHGVSTLSVLSSPYVAVTSAAANQTIEKFILSQHHPVNGLSVKYDEATKTVVLRGVAPDSSVRERVVLCCRKVIGVAHIDDRLTVAEPLSLESIYRAGRPGIATANIAKAEYSAVGT
jgi:hypothetical protein